MIAPRVWPSHDTKLTRLGYSRNRETVSTIDKAFGARLRHAMHDGRLRPAALARQLGVHPTTLSRWRRGERPQPGAMTALAAALSVPVEWLKTGVNPGIGPELAGRPELAGPTGNAARYYEGALKRLDGRVARAEEMGAEEARAMLMTLWDYAVREAPGLRPTSAPPAGDLYDVGSAIEAAETKQGKRGA